MEELRFRYQEFLRLVPEGTVAADQSAEAGDLSEGEHEQTEEAANREIDDNLNHQVEQLKVESIEAAYFDHNFWKPQVDYNLDDLLSEMNKNQPL